MVHRNVEVSDAWKVNVAVVDVPSAGPVSMVVSGAVVSVGATVVTVQARTAGEASVLPAASVARTLNECEPALRPLYDFGVVHAAKAAASIRHWNVEPDSVAVNANDALADDVEPLGPDVIVVSGGVVSVGGGALAPTTMVCMTCARRTPALL
jgi:hypothetical protein